MASLFNFARRVPISLPFRCISTAKPKYAGSVTTTDKKELQKVAVNMILKKDFMNRLGGRSLLDLAYNDPHYGKAFSSEVLHPDDMGTSVGSERYENLQRMLGNNDPFEMDYRNIRPKSTAESPNLVQSQDFRRAVCCICKPDDHEVKYMYIYQGTPTRCFCGHWFKLVTYEDRDRIEEVQVSRWLESMDKFPPARPTYDKLMTTYTQLMELEQKIEVESENPKDNYKALCKSAEDVLETVHELSDQLFNIYEKTYGELSAK